MSTRTNQDKALTALLAYGGAAYRRGLLDGLKVAEQITAWLTAEGDVTIADIHQWASTAITKAKENLSNGTN